MSLINNFIANIQTANFYTLVLSAFIALALTILVFTVFATRKTKKSSISKNKIITNSVITSHDIKAIAGDNVMTTQLDLARAYIEMDKNILAKKILEHVLQHGDVAQKNEANQLLTTL